MTAAAMVKTGRAEALTLLVLVVGFLHHIDHVLRVDHSGWPFREAVTGFTYSLAAYPLLLFALLARQASSWWRFAAVAFSAVATNAAHVIVETPADQYLRWARDQGVDGRYADISNMCGITSPAAGVASVTVAMLLNVGLVVTAVAWFAAARETQR